MKKIIFLICLLASLSFYAQVPSDIEDVDQDDLENLGVDEDDIEELKKEYKEEKETEKKKKEFVDPKENEEEEVKPEDKEEDKEADKEEEQDNEKKKLAPFEDPNVEPRIYGHELFDNRDLAVYKNAGHIKAPDNYVIGVGDEINIAIWGYSEHDKIYRVNSSGSIDVKSVGRVYLRGLTFGEARKLLTSRFGRVYDLKNSSISIELNYAKVIRVNIVGEVNNPGTYSVSSINTVFNVLALAGGLTDIAGVRSIAIKRNNEKVKELDVYKFLQDPSPENDYFLQDNDYIVVKPAENIVTARGTVMREGVYELKDGEGIKELIDYAGGMARRAVTTQARLQTYENNQQVFKQIDLQPILDGKVNVKLKNGDFVKFVEINSILRDYVTTKGAIEVAGHYKFSKGMKVSDLLREAGGLKFNAYLGRAYVIRTKDNRTPEYISVNLNEIQNDVNSEFNIPLKEFDKLEVYFMEDFNDDYYVEVLGAVRENKRIPYSQNLTVQDLIFMAGGMRPEAANARIEISRVSNFSDAANEDEPTRINIETINVSNDLEVLEKGFKLQPFDIVFVRSSPEFGVQQNIRITGEVKYPGTYSMINKKERLSSVIERAGGFTDWAFLEGATLLRISDSGDSAYVIMDLIALFEDGEKEFDYILKENDQIIIPMARNLVSIAGAVEYPAIDSLGEVYAPFRKGKRAKYYIKEYGAGFHDDAKKKKTYVETAGGHVKRTRNFGLFKIYPKVESGDKVVAVYKEIEEEKEDDGPRVDWNKAIENTTTKLTAIITVYLLAQSAFSSN